MSAVGIKSHHLPIRDPLALQIFGEEPRALLAYKKDRNLIMLTAASNQRFAKMHQASQHLVKQRNLQGRCKPLLSQIVNGSQLISPGRTIAIHRSIRLGNF